MPFRKGRGTGIPKPFSQASRASRIHHAARSRDSTSTTGVKSKTKMKGAPVKAHPIRAFFARYPHFDYNSEAPIFEEFRRMKEALNWKEKETEDKAWNALRDAVVKQFNAMYGTRRDDLTSWQLLCSALGMNPAPDSIEACQKEVNATHVNLVDFIEAPPLGKPIPTFTSEPELSLYTRKEGKYFPRKNVHSGSLLTSLLRHIKNPSALRGRPVVKSARQKRAKLVQHSQKRKVLKAAK